MAKKPPKKKNTRVNKLNAWLYHYTNAQNPVTFLNQTQSAKAAGYKASTDESFASIGSQNFQKLKSQIETWLDENGLSEDALKIKLVGLLEGEETKTVTIKGIIDPDSLPPNAQVIVQGVTTKYTKNGDSYDETETIIGINMQNKELQRRSLDMAFKIKGSYAPEKREHGVDNSLARLLKEIDGKTGVLPKLGGGEVANDD